jgi:hypothetical protein
MTNVISLHGGDNPRKTTGIRKVVTVTESSDVFRQGRTCLFPILIDWICNDVGDGTGGADARQSAPWLGAYSGGSGMA